MSDYGFWYGWERRNVTTAAEQQIALRNEEYWQWARRVQLEIEWYTTTEQTALAEQCIARREQVAQLHAARVAEITAAAEQQLSEIDSRYAAQERAYKDAFRALPNTTPRAPFAMGEREAWEPREEWQREPWPPSTPSPSYTPHSGPDRPAYEPSNAPDLPAWGESEQPEQSGLLDRLLSWLR